MKSLKKKAVIWGAGTLGTSNLLCELLEQWYEIVAYCDSDQTKWGTKANGYTVISVSETMELGSTGAFDVIVIAIYDAAVILEIKTIIEEKLSPAWSVEIFVYSEIADELEGAYISRMHKTLDFTRYQINYKKQYDIWLDNIMSEVDYWVNRVAKKNAPFRDDYCKRLDNDAFRSELTGNIDRLTDYLCRIKEPLVYDIGCGLAPRFGDILPNGNRISLVEIDPLAYFYNAVNARYAPTSGYKKITFGMFEYFSRFFDRNSADAVIINNALDHCIDPYKSIVESLMVLKPGGMLYLNHTRAEGINEKYDGLHQWNLDYTEDNDFIIWNYGSAVNVSRKLGNIASISIHHSNGWVCVEMIKKKDFVPEQYIDADNEMEYMAFIVNRLMEKLSDPLFNKAFDSMLIG